MPKFLKLLKIVEDSPSWASWSFQKRFLQYPYNFVHHAAIQNHNAAKFWDSEKLGVDRERGSLQSCFLIQDSKILLRLTRNFILFKNSRICVNNWLTVVGFISRCIDNSCVFYSTWFFATNSSQFFNFLAVSCMIFLEEPTSHFHFNIQADFISFSLFCPLTSLMWLESLRFKLRIGLLKSSVRISLFSQFLASTSASASYSFCWAILYLLGRPNQLSVQGFSGDFLCLSTNARRLDLDLSPFCVWPEESWNNRFSVHIHTSFLNAITNANRLTIRHLFPEAITKRSEHGGNSPCCGMLAADGCFRVRNFWIFGSWDDGGVVTAPETSVIVRDIDRRVLLVQVTVEVGLISCV